MRSLQSASNLLSSVWCASRPQKISSETTKVETVREPQPSELGQRDDQSPPIEIQLESFSEPNRLDDLIKSRQSNFVPIQLEWECLSFSRSDDRSEKISKKFSKKKIEKKFEKKNWKIKALRKTGVVPSRTPFREFDELIDMPPIQKDSSDSFVKIQLLKLMLRQVRMPPYELQLLNEKLSSFLEEEFKSDDSFSLNSIRFSQNLLKKEKSFLAFLTSQIMNDSGLQKQILGHLLSLLNRLSKTEAENQKKIRKIDSKNPKDFQTQKNNFQILSQQRISMIDLGRVRGAISELISLFSV